MRGGEGKGGEEGRKGGGERKRERREIRGRCAWGGRERGGRREIKGRDGEKEKRKRALERKMEKG